MIITFKINNFNRFFLISFRLIIMCILINIITVLLYYRRNGNFSKRTWLKFQTNPSKFFKKNQS